jgi:hypothetical protein
MAEDLKTPSLDYGVIVAFVAPGFVAFYATSYQFPGALNWTTAASEKDPTVGIFLFVLLASLSTGLVVSGVRALLVDHVLRSRRLLGRFAVPTCRINWSKVDDKKLRVVNAIRDGHYRYYQFYSNTFVAMVFWVCSRSYAVKGAAALTWGRWALIFAMLLALLVSARESLLRYATALEQSGST